MKEKEDFSFLKKRSKKLLQMRPAIRLTGKPNASRHE
jgi:hypothetical protein